MLEDGLPGKVHWAHLLPENPQGMLWKDEVAESVHALDHDALAGALALEEEFARARAVRRTGGRERAILVGTGGRGRGRAEAEASLAELRELARTAGVEVIDATLQLRRDPDPRYLIGKGKLEDIVLRSMQLMATVIVFDAELTPSQARHIAEATSLKILDRTQLILDIFAQRAQSADGKLQVELAQLRYLYPRLVGRDDSLSRLAGGIGGRGPGETKLEIDRRRVRDRITALERRIEALGAEPLACAASSATPAGCRCCRSSATPTPASRSLLNALTDSAVLAEDKLFATLDPTSRRLRFPRDREVIITDTVGFIRDLPPDLVNAFRATLEELSDADLLLHVVDASDPRHEEQIAAVEQILGGLGLDWTGSGACWSSTRPTWWRPGRRPPWPAPTATRPRSAPSPATACPSCSLRCERLLWAEGRVALGGAGRSGRGSASRPSARRGTRPAGGRGGQTDAPAAPAPDREPPRRGAPRSPAASLGHPAPLVR